jgi:hypothetical protein
MAQTATIKRLFTGACPNTQTTVYTAPGSKSIIITSVTVHNTDTAARTLQIWIVPSGGAAGATNKLLQAVIGTNQTFVYDKSIVLETGDFLVAQCGATNLVAMHLFGTEVVTV